MQIFHELSNIVQGIFHFSFFFCFFKLNKKKTVNTFFHLRNGIR